jgi:hypothetical protein
MGRGSKAATIQFFQQVEITSSVCTLFGQLVPQGAFAVSGVRLPFVAGGATAF